MTGSLAPMPRRASGSIEEHQHADGRTSSFYLRVRANGQRHRITLGTNQRGWSHDRAQVELDGILEKIERGTWTPPKPVARLNDPHETFHVAASRWWTRRQLELAPNTQADYRWRLDHLLRQIAREPVTNLDTRRVDEVRAKLIGRGLSARSVNMILDLLAQVLDDAVEEKLLDANPARGKRRRVKLPKQRRSFLEADMVLDLLTVAGEWERNLPPHQRYGRRALLAGLVLGGFRISELLHASRGALDLHGGRLRVGDAKTEAGLRDVELSEFLLSELRGHVAHLPPPPGGLPYGPPVFPSRTGHRLNPSNIRNRLLAEVVDRANAKRESEGRMLLPHVTPHTCRRTFVSLALSFGRDPRWVMAQVGHTDPRLTLGVYAQIVTRQREDHDLIRTLMSFPGEQETSMDPIEVER